MADLDALRRDDDAWDAFVESTPNGEYLQLSAWAKVKAPNGWRSVRVVADGGSGPIGAQVLLHKLGPLPASLGYATCGPVAATLDKASIDAFTAELRHVARRERLSHITIDPTVGDPAVARAAARGRLAQDQDRAGRSDVGGRSGQAGGGALAGAALEVAAVRPEVEARGRGRRGGRRRGHR